MVVNHGPHRPVFLPLKEQNRAEIAFLLPIQIMSIFYVANNPIQALGLYRSIDGGQSFTLQANSPNLFAYDESGSDLDAEQKLVRYGPLRQS